MNPQSESKPITPWGGTPQAAEIDALVERAGQMTGTEVIALRKAWRATWGTKLCAAMDAAWEVALDVYREGAVQAAMSAAVREARAMSHWTSSEDARGATYAVVALAIRDLIDEALDWNQAAYDLLTAAWAKVIGPAHPDDRKCRYESSETLSFA